MECKWFLQSVQENRFHHSYTDLFHCLAYIRGIISLSVHPHTRLLHIITVHIFVITYRIHRTHYEYYASSHSFVHGITFHLSAITSIRIIVPPHTSTLIHIHQYISTLIENQISVYTLIYIYEYIYPHTHLQTSTNTLTHIHTLHIHTLHIIIRRHPSSSSFPPNSIRNEISMEG